jgi:hypothetical protein
MWKRRAMILRDTKNGDDRVVPLSKEALDIVSETLRQPADDPRVFPLTRDAIASAWRRLLERAAIEDFRFHDLRHEATSRLFERGLSVMEVQRITGHKTLAMLLRYTHMDVGRLVQRLDATDAQPPRAPTSTEPVKARDSATLNVRAASTAESGGLSSCSHRDIAAPAPIGPEFVGRSDGMPSAKVIPFVPRR